MLDFFTALNQNGFDDYRLQGVPGRVTAYLAQESDCTEPGCGWDPLSQSGKRMDCPICHGQGKTVTFQTYVVRARVVWGANAFAYFKPSPGVELGDVTLGIVPSDTSVIEAVLQEASSYLIVDGKTVRPTNTSPSVVPGIEESVLVSCNLYTNSIEPD